MTSPKYSKITINRITFDDGSRQCDDTLAGHLQWITGVPEGHTFTFSYSDTHATLTIDPPVEITGAWLDRQRAFHGPKTTITVAP